VRRADIEFFGRHLDVVGRVAAGVGDRHLVFAGVGSER
jgi:hypothetical protein